MSDHKSESAYTHRTTVTGSGDHDDPALEHQDTVSDPVSGEAGAHNEIAEDRGDRRTHADTRIDRKQGS